jgi:hypothetical protein
LEVTIEELHSFGKGFIKLKNSVKGGWNIYLGIGKRSDFCMWFGWVNAHSWLNIGSFSTSATNNSGRFTGFWRMDKEI